MTRYQSQELQGASGELLWSNAKGFFSEQIHGVGMCLRRALQREGELWRRLVLWRREVGIRGAEATQSSSDSTV